MPVPTSRGRQHVAGDGGQPGGVASREGFASRRASTMVVVKGHGGTAEDKLTDEQMAART